MDRAWRVSLLVTLLSLIHQVPAFACRCTEPTLTRAFARADAVALVRVDQLSEPSQDGTVTAQVDVLNAWKVQLPATVQLVTGDDCAYPFKLHETYLAYLSRGKDVWGTYRCRGNRPEKAAGSTIRWLNLHAPSHPKP